MPGNNFKTPGVYIDEINAFPNAVVPVATSIAAFVGYTPQAMYEGKSYTNIPQRITSLAEFHAIYGYPNDVPSAPAPKQYEPQYYVVKQSAQPTQGNYIKIDTDFYSMAPDPNTIYYLYNSIRLFFNNGGGEAYIVSVGSYGPPLGNPIAPGDPIVNQNVRLNDLLHGVDLLKKGTEPTIYICPEASLLSIQENGALMQAMLLQNEKMQTAISIFDVIGGRDPDPITYMQDIQTFRNHTGSNGLSFGAAYYPFVGTTVMQASELDYRNLFGGDLAQLKSLLSPATQPNEAVDLLLEQIDTLTPQQLNTSLVNSSTMYASIMKHMLTVVNLLPSSGGMAGVISRVDNQLGVWKAPANVSIVGVTDLPIKLSNDQQADLNVDAASGKSINAIRFFQGQGILVWGARTLDGNSSDWRYLSVRRTVSMIEQSSKLAARTSIFEPNDANTWKGITSMISNFLKSIWKEGGLQGAKATDAYFVSCGLGSTMTTQDILEGRLKVSIGVAIVRPAEFIIISFEQEMAKT